MARIKAGIRPKSGFSNILHLGLMVLLPMLLYVLVRIDFALLAAVLVVLSKWRMFAVRPRYWPANIRANAVDIMVGLSAVAFMDATSIVTWQVAWAVLYGLWLIFLKPGSSAFLVSIQAGVAQLVALMALFLELGGSALVGLVLGSWLICYLCARHFFSSFDEPYASLFAYTWGYFAAALTWVLGHWLLFYGVVAQPTLLLLVIGYGLGALYYLDTTERLSSVWQQQFIIMMIIVIAAVLTFSDWGDKAI